MSLNPKRVQKTESGSSKGFRQRAAGGLFGGMETDSSGRRRDERDGGNISRGLAGAHAQAFRMCIFFFGVVQVDASTAIQLLHEVKLWRKRTLQGGWDTKPANVHCCWLLVLDCQLSVVGN